MADLDLGPTVYNLIDGLVRFLEINFYSATNTTQPRLLVDSMPEVYSRNSDVLLRRLLSRKGFTAAQRRAMLQRVRERGSAYLAPLNAFYVRRFRYDLRHRRCRALSASGLSRPARSHQRKNASAAQSAGRFFAASLEHALACFGSRILHPARPAFRDRDLQELYELTREDLEQRASLPYSDVVETLDFLAWHRQSGHAQPGRPAGPDWTRVLAFSGRKWEYVTEQFGCLLGNDLYDAYIEGRLAPAALRRLFLAHLEEPGAASDVYANLNTRLR